MDAWTATYERVLEIIDNEPADVFFFRGHGDATWALRPGLARRQREENIERIAYFDFVTRAGELLSHPDDSWANLFAMQHHGLPTRLLDWSETFGVALYFALAEGEGDAAVWILDPFELNRRSVNCAEILRPANLDGTYAEYYIYESKKPEGNVVAISPLRHNPRILRQRAGFTLHDDLDTSLDELHADVLRKVMIPTSARAGAKRFLELAGISEFTLFPDLDGLARDLCREHYPHRPNGVT